MIRRRHLAPMRFVPTVLLLAATCVERAESAARAQEEGSAEAQVRVRVVASLALGTNTPNICVRFASPGELSATAAFQIRANRQRAGLSVQASPLCRGSAGLASASTMIPLADSGVVITPENAAPVGGGSNQAHFVEEAPTPGDLPARKTETIIFESGQNGRFSQEVLVTVKWLQNDPLRAPGVYRGYVKLTALLMP